MTTNNLITFASNVLRVWRERFAPGADVRRLRADRLDDVARDLGVPAARRPALLVPAAQFLGLERADLEQKPGLLHHLHALCVDCGKNQACVSDLAGGRPRADFDAYCPRAGKARELAAAFSQ
jgi:hypothetical protein